MTEQSVFERKITKEDVEQIFDLVKRANEYAEKDRELNREKAFNMHRFEQEVAAPIKQFLINKERDYLSINNPADDKLREFVEKNKEKISVILKSLK